MRRATGSDGGRHGQRPNEKQQREEETKGKQEDRHTGGFAVYFNRSQGKARPRRRSEKDLLRPLRARAGRSGARARAKEARYFSLSLPLVGRADAAGGVGVGGQLHPTRLVALLARLATLPIKGRDEEIRYLTRNAVMK